MASQKWSTSFISILVAAGVALAQNGCNEMVPGTSCMQPLLQIFEEIKPFILPGDRIDEFCAKWEGSIACVESLKKQCKFPIESSFKMSDNYHRLCNNDQNYRREYLKNVGCLQNTARGCFVNMMTPPAGGTSGGQRTGADKARREKTESCRKMDDFYKCVQTQATQQCDNDAAAFSSRFLTTEKRAMECNDVSRSATVCSSLLIVALSLLAMFSCKHLL